MKVNKTSIEVFWEETKVIRPTIPDMIKGLSQEMNNILSNSEIITKSELDAMNYKFNAVRDNLAPYASDTMSILRSVAKPRKDGSTLAVDAAVLDDLRAYRADVQDALENIRHMAESFRKRANLHNMAHGDFNNLLEPDPDILVPDVFAAAGITGNDPKDVAAPAAE